MIKVINPAMLWTFQKRKKERIATFSGGSASGDYRWNKKGSSI